MKAESIVNSVFYGVLIACGFWGGMNVQRVKMHQQNYIFSHQEWGTQTNIPAIFGEARNVNVYPRLGRMSDETLEKHIGRPVK